MNHPAIEQIERTGFPKGVADPDHFGLDALGNEVFEGDEIYVLHDEFFLKETLLAETREALEVLGAEEKKP